jgi:replicative DNA helicase
MTSGWQRSDLIIIAARPAMGKTAFVLSMAKNMAEAGYPVALFSLEMSNVQLVNRLLVNVCEIPGEKIKNGNLAPYEWEQLHHRVRNLYDMPIFVDDTPSLSIFELNTKARRLVKEHKVTCIIIDYLQLMNASGMNLSKELNIPIIALSQLNRGVEGRTGADKRPQLADLRESGAIEQDADMVLFIHRPEYYKITEDGQGNSLLGIAEIIISKHRNGAVGDVRLRFKSELAKFMNVTDDFEKGFAGGGQTTFESKVNNNEDNFEKEGAAIAPAPNAQGASPFQARNDVPF